METPRNGEDSESVVRVQELSLVRYCSGRKFEMTLVTSPVASESSVSHPIRRRISLGLAVAGLTLGLSRPVMGQTDQSDTDLANSLAAELEKAGVDLSKGDLTAMLQGITNGGEQSEALARSISRALMQATSDLDAVAAGQEPGPGLDQSEIDRLLASLPSTGDSAGTLARFLKDKLQELEKAQQELAQ